MAGPYCLKRDAHCDTVLDQLFRDDTFADVTLTAEGKSIKAHKSVLSLASSYFQQVLWKEPNTQSVIVFRDIEFSELKSLIKFIYTGEAIVDAHDLKSFMSTAQSLQILSLCEPRTDNVNFTDNEEEHSESGKRLADSTNSPKHSGSSVHCSESATATSGQNKRIKIKAEPTDFMDETLRQETKEESQLTMNDSSSLDSPSTSLPKIDCDPNEPCLKETENQSSQERLSDVSDALRDHHWLTIEEAASSGRFMFGRSNALLPSENSSDDAHISPSLTYARGRIYPSPAQESLKKLIIRTEAEVNELYAKMDANLANLEDRNELDLKRHTLVNYKKLLRSKINAARRSMKSREKRKLIRDSIVTTMPTSKGC